MSPGRVTIGDRVAWAVRGENRDRGGGGGDAGAITFANAHTGHTVARVDTGGGDLVTVAGSLLSAQPGETLPLQGRWGAHPQCGR